MGVYLKSTLWLLGCTGIGYVLLKVTTPNETDLAKIRKEYTGILKEPVDSLEKKHQFVDVLKAVAETNRPIHRLGKQEIEQLKPKDNIKNNRQ